MKKEIKNKSSSNVVVLHKLSLAMTILVWVAIGLIVVGLVIAIIARQFPVEERSTINSIGSGIALAGIGIGLLSSFLSIGEFILNKRVVKISDKLSTKTSTIVFAVFFALTLLAIVFLGIHFATQPRPGYSLISKSGLKPWVIAALASLTIGLIGQAIMSTIVMVKTKAK